MNTLAANDLSSFKALRTDIDLMGIAVLNDGNFLDIGVDHAVGNAVRMADITSG